jgi:hypothetical protein
MMAERGLSLAHTTIPALGEALYARIRQTLEPLCYTCGPLVACRRDLSEDSWQVGLPVPGGGSVWLDGGLYAQGEARRGRGQSLFQHGHQASGPVAGDITLDGYSASHRAVREMKADDLLPADTQVRSSTYLNNLIEVRHEVAYRSYSHFPPHRRREPPVSPGESRSLNQERL